MIPLPDLPALWGKKEELESARKAALQWARERATRSPAPEDQPVIPQSVHQAAHEGKSHVDFWNAQFPQLLARLPGKFSALEVGCGLGWHAALTAAATDATVIAAEYKFGPDGVHSPGNATTFRRLAQWAPQLHQVVEFTAWDRMTLDPRIQFVQATAHSLPLPDACVDLVYTYNCLEHIPDLTRFFQEVTRVLRPGGYLFASAQPLYYSPFGHHLESLFPLPWGHLLWEPNDFANVMLEEAERLGPLPLGHHQQPIQAGGICDLLRTEVNHARPSHLRQALASAPWRIHGWVDLVPPENIQWLKRLGIQRALRALPTEALITTGVHLCLQRCSKPQGWRLPMRLPVTWRSNLRRWIPRFSRPGS